jgi:two-component system chemotaxis response regulator CheB
MIKLLIVDDSALMRKTLVQIFQDEDDIEISACTNGVEALAELHEYQPDVITLDINMPAMDGLTCLSRIMQERPTPVIMLSSLTQKGAMATFEAMALGAVDIVAKPGGTISLNLAAIGKDLISKVRTASKAKARRCSPRSATPPARVADKSNAALAIGHGLVVIGVSTGGPGTLQEVLPNLPSTLPWPILIAQHMPGSFTKSFAERLDQLCPLHVREIARPTLIDGPGIYIARGDSDMVVRRQPKGLMLVSKPSDPKYLWHPSVDQLVESAFEAIDPGLVLGVLLTGMGNDGAGPMARLRTLGGHTIAESDATAVVYGMPRELIQLGGACEVAPYNEIATRIVRHITNATRRQPICR